MAHIHDILSEITQFLNGRDHSCSERFRNLAEDYTTACRDVIDSLEECRKLIASGQALQALNLNKQASPMLTERARLLIFPGRPQWLELCSLYRVPLPPEFDMELINQLESKELSESIEQISDLVSQWHVLGHTGTNHEKIILLRKLIQKDKTTKIWRKNLEIAEKAWCRELLNGAAAAQKIKDYACLDSIMVQLNSPDLLHPVQPSLLEPFQKDLRIYRTASMQKKQEQVLSGIINAYEMEDIEALGSALCKWTMLSEDPLFVAPNGTDSEILRKAQEHYRKKTEQIMLQNRADELHKKINAQIGACESFPQIRAVMFQLKELSLPIDPNLENRYKALEDEYVLMQKRKAGIKRLIWCSVIVIFCLMVCGTVFAVNRMNAIQNICSEMQSFLQAKKPQDVIAYYADLKKKNNPYIADEDILALYNQAIGLQKQYESEILIFGKLLTDIKTKLKLKDIDQAGKLFAEAKSGKLYHTSRQDEELLSLSIRQNELIRERQKSRNNEFERQFISLQTNSKKLIQMLNTPDKYNIEDIKQKFEKIKEQQKFLLQNQLLASRDVVESRSDTLKHILVLLTDRIKCFDGYTTLKGKLYTPESAASYLEFLNEISKLNLYSKILGSSFADALQQKELLQQYLSADINTFATGMEGSPHPYIKDICAINPSPKIMNDIRMRIAQLKKDISAKWDLYEIILETNKKKMYFYLQAPLNDDNLRVYRAHGRAGGAFKDMRMNICTPNGQSQELLFKITSKSKGLYNLKLVKEVNGIPDQFIDIPRMKLLSLTNRNNIDKALHYTLFNHTLDRLLKITDTSLIRKQIVNEIGDYIAENKMNPAAKIIVIQRLMELYGEISTLDSCFVEQIKQQCKLPNTNPLDYHAGTSKLQEKLTFFTSSAFQKMLINRKKTLQLYQDVLSSMLPIPAGVIYKSGTEYWVHFFDSMQHRKIYFTYLNDGSDYRFYVFPDHVLKTSKQPISQLPAPLQKIYNGTVFFATDLLVQKELQEAAKDTFSIPFSMPVFPRGTK